MTTAGYLQPTDATFAIARQALHDTMAAYGLAGNHLRYLALNKLEGPLMLQRLLPPPPHDSARTEREHARFREDGRVPA